MKRIFLAALAALALLLTAAPRDATAGRWVSDEIGWRITSQGTPTSATAIYVRDTAFTVVKDAADTTGWFNLAQADPWGIRSKIDTVQTTIGGGTDTTAFAFLVLVADSTVTTAETISNVTCTFQLAPMSTRQGTSAATTVQNFTSGAASINVMTSGDRAVVFPITFVNRGFSGANTDLLQVAAVGPLSMRGIISGAVTDVMAMARAYVMWYDADN